MNCVGQLSTRIVFNIFSTSHTEVILLEIGILQGNVFRYSKRILGKIKCDKFIHLQDSDGHIFINLEFNETRYCACCHKLAGECRNKYWNNILCTTCC